MDDSPAPPTRLRVAALPARKPHRFDIRPDPDTRDAIARELGLSALLKLGFAGHLRADGASDWRLEARLGATVVQPCVVTLEPVTTRIDTDVTRRFVQDWQELPKADEIEMPEDVSTERLGDTIDLMSVLTEALALALPDYPRSPGATLGDARFAEDGVTPLRDEDTKPFAALAALRAKLQDPQE